MIYFFIVDKIVPIVDLMMVRSLFAFQFEGRSPFLGRSSANPTNDGLNSTEFVDTILYADSSSMYTNTSSPSIFSPI